MLADSQRLAVISGWATLMVTALPAMLLLARSHRVPNIILRKGYHVLAVSLFLPALLSQPQLLGMALAVAFAGLLAVEVLRTGGIPHISTRLHQFMASFVDKRDSGAMYVTHLTLLLGMAVPVWLSGAVDDVPPKEAVERLWPGALAGIIITGLGDAAASIVGSQIGRVPIAPGSHKTVEGTVAGAVTVLAAWVGLIHAGLIAQPEIAWGIGGGISGQFWSGSGWVVAMVAATVLSSLLEAATEQLDNLFVPLHYFSLLCCLFK